MTFAEVISFAGKSWSNGWPAPFTARTDFRGESPRSDPCRQSFLPEPEGSSLLNSLPSGFSS